MKNTGPTPFVLILLLSSLFLIYNATAYSSYQLFGKPYHFLFSQIAWVLIGLFFYLIFSKLSFKKLEKLFSIAFFINVFILLILGFVGIFVCTSDSSIGIPFAPCVNGASRWFYINPEPFPQIPLLGVLSFQPGELLKLTLVLYLSFKLTKLKGNDALLIFGISTGVCVLLLLMQPNMSTAVMILLLSSIIYFCAGHSIKPFIIGVPIVMVISLLLILSSPYRRARLSSFLENESVDDQGSGYHIRQIQIALGSGGIFGVGFGQSRQKFQYLPEIATDSIFAIVGEEFGFIGTASLLVVFFLLIRVGFKVAENNTKEARVISIGIISWVTIQLFVNISAMTGLIPLTGVPIPLISYGGSSMVFSLIGLGILNNIAKKGDLK